MQPAQQLTIDAENRDWKNRHNDFFGMDLDHDFPLYSKGDDSLLLTTIRINIVKSTDSLFHVYRIAGSQGRSSGSAAAAAGKIVFDPIRSDSILIFPQGFFISREDKFRNQRVVIVVEVPVGKTIAFGDGISAYHWMDFKWTNRHGDFDDWDYDNEDRMFSARPGKTYEMHADGRPRVLNK